MKTYQDIKNWIDGFSPEELQLTATVHDGEDDEYFGVDLIERTGNDADVLDPKHPIMVIRAENML
jgi:hypothetical protein